MLRGKICWHFYDDFGNETESIVLDANGDMRCINVEKARWHSLECLAENSVLLESKDGKYEPLREDEIQSLDSVGKLRVESMKYIKAVW